MTMAPVCRCTIEEALQGHSFPHCPYYDPCERCGGVGYITVAQGFLPGEPCPICKGTGAKPVTVIPDAGDAASGEERGF